MDNNTLAALASIGMAAARDREPLQDDPPAPEPPRLAVAEIECHDGATIWRTAMTETASTPVGPLVRVELGQVLDRFDPRDYATTQPADIPAYHHHDRSRRVGRVVFLAWGQGEPARIRAVLEIDAAEAEFWEGRTAYVSPGTKRNAAGRLELDHVGLVEATARIAASPVTWPGTTFGQCHLWTRQTVPGYDLLVRAHAARRQGTGIPIVGHPGHDEQLEELRDAGSPAYMRNNGEGGLFYSGGVGRILNVS
jgi:hypothetical protein